MGRTACEPANTFAPGGPRGDGWSGRHSLHPEAHPFHWQQQLADTPASTRLSGARTDAPKHAEASGLQSLSDGGTGGVENLTELTPDLRSDGSYGRPTGVQRPKKGRQAKRTAGKAALTQRSTRKGDPGDSKDSMVQVKFHIL